MSYYFRRVHTSKVIRPAHDIMTNSGFGSGVGDDDKGNEAQARGDSETEGTPPSTSTTAHPSAHPVSDSEGPNAASRYLIKRPKALQWFHRGRLQRESEEERQAGRFELFLDLLYVALVANFAEDLAARPSGAELVKYLLIFAPAWHVWSDLREVMNSYYTDDLVQRGVILWVMALLVLYGNNATLVADPDTGIGAMRTAVGAFMAARLTVAVVYTVSSFASWQHRTQARLMAACMVVGLFIWIPLFFEGVSLRAKIAVAVVAIVYQETTWIAVFSPWVKRRLDLEYSTAVDIGHEIDRLAAFFIIVLGEYLYSIVVGNPAAVGLNSGLLKAVWTLIIAFCLNWLYVNGDGSVSSVHPIRRSATTAFAFFGLHMPLAASLLVGGHVCAESAGHADITHGERWLMGGGLGVGMFCLWILSILFKGQDTGELMMPKMIRVAMRLIVAIILVLLPLVNEEHFDAVQLLSTVMGLIVFVTVWETVGGLMKGSKIYEPWEGRNLAPKYEQ
jgi:low temperature requirement protein LtrA